MRKILSYFVLLTVFGIISFNCKSSTEPEPTDSTDTSGLISLTGSVINYTNGAAIQNAVIRILHDSTESSYTTDAQGKFTAEITIKKSQAIVVIGVKEGFFADTANVYAIAGRTVEVTPLRLKARQSGAGTSGYPASIVLFSQSVNSIGVKGSGSVENASIVFQVQDSTGSPIDLNHAATVSFRIGAKPGGGEAIYPYSVKTDADGKAQLSITSGTKAGVIQIVAEINTVTYRILSKPVNISIHGGLPDQAHFSVAPEKLNIPGYNVSGVVDKITAYVGDKYSNPVKPGTSVYFKTTGGIIEGSALTGSMGTGTVSLITADPKPVHPLLGKGFATITATTADEDFNNISTETTVLFSGLPFISVNPTNVDIPFKGSQNFVYTVMDQNGNPLSSGTAITVTVEGDNLKSTGDLTINLPDTQSKGWTQFSFTVANTDTVAKTRPVNITIKTQGPNGANKLSISGLAK